MTNAPTPQLNAQKLLDYIDILQGFWLSQSEACAKYGGTPTMKSYADGRVAMLAEIVRDITHGDFDI